MRQSITQSEPSLSRGTLPIRPAAIEVDQNVPRLGAFAGAGDAAALQFVHDAGGAELLFRQGRRLARTVSVPGDSMAPTRTQERENR